MKKAKRKRAPKRKAERTRVATLSVEESVRRYNLGPKPDTIKRIQDSERAAMRLLFKSRFDYCC